jgi:hypothetical protein
MLQDLPRVLASYPNLALGTVLNQWSAAVRRVGNLNPRATDPSVTRYWCMLFDFLSELCPKLGCVLHQDLEDPGARSGVQMDWWLGLNGVVTIAGESKTERVLLHHSADMEGLAGVRWLGWENETTDVRGGRAIVLKVSCFHCFSPH